MKLHESKYKNEIGAYFNYSVDFEFLDLVADTLESALDCESDDDIYQSIADNLIYYADQWRIIEHYQTPQEANFENAFNDFENDIIGLVNQIKGK